MEFADEVPIANEVTHVATKERRDDVLIMFEEAALLLRRHRSAEIGWCDRDMLEVECMELESFSRIGVHAPAARYCPLLAGLHFATWLVSAVVRQCA